MGKKGMSLAVKILIGLPLVLTFLAGVNDIFIGFTRADIIGKIITSPQAMFVTYVIVGLSVLATATILSFKVFKE